MVSSTIYDDRIIVIPSKVLSLPCISQIGEIWNASIQQHESVVVVSFWPETENYTTGKRGTDKAFKKATDILKKNNIPYKLKKFVY